jgi:hypothetical protein
MTNNHPRMDRERTTVEAMIDIYCRRQHRTDNGLCPDCEALREYARQRLQGCPFQEGKTTCAKCPVHCYKPDMRERIRAVMRCAGPHMLYRHPILTFQHMVDGRRKEPVPAHGARTNQADVVTGAKT